MLSVAAVIPALVLRMDKSPSYALWHRKISHVLQGLPKNMDVLKSTLPQGCLLPTSQEQLSLQHTASFKNQASNMTNSG